MCCQVVRVVGLGSTDGATTTPMTAHRGDWAPCGHPSSMVHPVHLVGRLIETLVEGLARSGSRRSELPRGWAPGGVRSRSGEQVREDV